MIRCIVRTAVPTLVQSIFGPIRQLDPIRQLVQLLLLVRIARIDPLIPVDLLLIPANQIVALAVREALAVPKVQITPAPLLVVVIAKRVRRSVSLVLPLEVAVANPLLALRNEATVPPESSYVV